MNYMTKEIGIGLILMGKERWLVDGMGRTDYQRDGGTANNLRIEHCIERYVTTE